MRAKLIRENTEGSQGYEPWEDSVRMDGFTLDSYYEVVAIYQIRSRCHLLLTDDLGRLSSRFSYCFELETSKIPEDWVVNIDNDYLTIMMGPEFAVRDYTTLAKLISYDAEMMDALKSWYLAEDG